MALAQYSHEGDVGQNIVLQRASQVTATLGDHFMTTCT